MGRHHSTHVSRAGVRATCLRAHPSWPEVGCLADRLDREGRRGIETSQYTQGRVSRTRPQNRGSGGVIAAQVVRVLRTAGRTSPGRPAEG